MQHDREMTAGRHDDSLGAIAPDSRGINALARELVGRVQGMDVASCSPLVVGLDGRSGCGKSTLAAAFASAFAAELGDRLGDSAGSTATVIGGDDFYAGGSARTWDARNRAEKVTSVIDWRRQRTVLTELVERGVAEWQAFDWDVENWDDDVAPLRPTPTVARATPVVVLEGVYSCRPELHDLLDLRVLLEVRHDLRRRRLIEREGSDHDPAWDRRWSEAEDHYFASVMPDDRFDLILRA